MKSYIKKQIGLSESRSKKSNKREISLITKTENVKRKKTAPTNEESLPTNTEPRVSIEGNLIKKRQPKRKVKKKKTFSKRNKYLHLVLAKAGLNNRDDNVKNEHSEKFKDDEKSDRDSRNSNQIDERVKLRKKEPKGKNSDTMGGEWSKRKKRDVSSEENVEEIETDKSLHPMKKKRKLASDQSDSVKDSAKKHKLSPLFQSDRMKNFATKEESAKPKKKFNSNDPLDIKERAKSLNKRISDKLSGSQFRYINEKLYTSTGKEALEMFTENKKEFEIYHRGYRNQVSKWPVNPLEKIINDIKNGSSKLVIADFGCGDASLAASVSNFVYSFDLVALNDRVTVCDIAHVPLKANSIDVAVFCLSLMGVNFREYLIEANRVLKKGGLLKIAEIESRFTNIDKFVKKLKRLGFTLLNKDDTQKMFVLLDLKKTKGIDVNRVPKLKLNPCLYKKR